MNIIGKFAISLVAIAAFGAIILASTSAGSKSMDQSATIGAAAGAAQSGTERFNYLTEFTRWADEPPIVSVR
jgi:hypothetical protein